MINLEIVFISLSGLVEDVKNDYVKLSRLIPNTIKILIVYHNSIGYLDNLFSNLPPTLNKIIVLDHMNRYELFKNKTIVDTLKNNFKHIPFGCKVYYYLSFCYDDDNNDNYKIICLIS